MFAATAILSLAVWLFVAAAEIYTPLHAWLHGGTIPKDDDDCAIVAIAHGKVETSACAVPATVPMIWIETAPPHENSVFLSSTVFLPDGRGPPVFSFLS